MKKKITKYILILVGVFISLIFYLSVVGIETERFNNQIKDKITQSNNKIDFRLKKIKLKLDPLRLKINAKTIGAKIIYQNKILELEYIKLKISLISLIKNKLVSSKLNISTKSIPLKDLIRFARVISDNSKLFFLELAITKGRVIIDLEVNFDKDGKIKNDYKIYGLLKDGKINLFKDYEFKKIDFILDIKNNIYNFRNTNFTIDNNKFSLDNLKVKRNKNNFLFEGMIENKKSILSDELFHLIKLKNINLKKINFDSKNKFSFKLDKNLQLKDLSITSNIQINKSELEKPEIINKKFIAINNIIHLKDHKIKATYKQNNLSVKGSGKIQLQKGFDEIDYIISSNGSDFHTISNITLSELSLKNHQLTKKFFPEINGKINLKNHKININYKDDDLSVKGSGKIQLQKRFDEIDYTISKIENKFNFNTKLNLDETLLKIDNLNYKKEINSKIQLILVGDYIKNKGLNLNKLSILGKNSRIILKNLILDEENKIIKVDKIDLNYLDTQNKKNQFVIKVKQKNNYELNGSIFNANNLISDLLKSKEGEETKIFKNNINLILNLKEVYIDDINIVKNLKGKLNIKNNKVVHSNINAFFDNNENLTFTINTNDKGEKITTFFSSRAKPIVKRYKFIKGYEEGYLDFYSFKKDKISKSTLKIHDFKLQEVPALTKILTLASLQGIADLLSGEGIRFNEFEMNFTNQNNLMTIDEIYAIGPAISILMEGYVQYDKLVSLKGTLVPATTLNKAIGSIPLLGKILVGSKVGEGVFGVSFKIKGPPKDLQTSVNPIKTLTPRFITRTLEKIKKN